MNRAKHCVSLSRKHDYDAYRDACRVVAALLQKRNHGTPS
jgi:hypothetical protein